ncbi:MAG: hypothetical protein KIT09_27690 [Bryobacteraceae bacterium]|nr:hypothetical protein [Bryobacteraceae bacterium]
MAQIGYTAAETLLKLLRSSRGIENALAQICLREDMQIPAIAENQTQGQNVASDLAEKNQAVRYPALYVYCDKAQNTLREKFRSFSGTARLNIEIRASKEKLDGLERLLHLYVDAVTQVLTQSRGDWGQGICYSGAYEVQVAAAKAGGANYIQSAKVVLEVGVSQA